MDGSREPVDWISRSHLYYLHPALASEGVAILHDLSSGMRGLKDTEPFTDVGRSRRWNYACQICGAPFESRPKFCYQCGKGTVVSIDRVLDGGSST